MTRPIRFSPTSDVNLVQECRNSILSRSVEVSRNAFTLKSLREKPSKKSEMSETIKFTLEKRNDAKGKSTVPLTCAEEMRVLPAAFLLAEPMKDPGNQMPTASYTFGKVTNSYSDWDQ